MGMKKLVTVHDNFMAESLLAALKDLNIDAYIEYEGAGQYMKILAGNTIYGKSVYVNEEDYEVALKVIEQLNEKDDCFPKTPEEQEINNANKKWYQRRRAFAWIVIAFIVMIVIVITIYGN